MKKKFNFEDLIDDYGVFILIFIVIPFFSLFALGIEHLMEYKGNHPFFCKDRYLDIFGYLLILFLLIVAIVITIEFFQKNGFKKGIRKILISLFYLIGFIIFVAIFTGNGDGDDGGREPRYDNCSKC